MERYTVSETDSAFEALLLKKNGDPKTVQDLFECFVAMHHDQKSNWANVIRELREVAKCVDQHQTRDVNMTKEEFAEFMAGRDRILKEMEDRINAAIVAKVKERDALLAKIDKEIMAIWKEIHRADRRSGDGADENWSRSVFGDIEDEEMGDLRRFWRVVKWGVLATGGAFLVAFGSELHQWIFH